MTDLQMSFICDCGRHPHGLPLALGNLLAEVVQDAVHNIGRTQMGGVGQVEGNLWVLQEPGTVFGCVVEDQVRHGEDPPLCVHLLDQCLKVGHCVCYSAEEHDSAIE